MTKSGLKFLSACWCTHFALTVNKGQSLMAQLWDTVESGSHLLPSQSWPVLGCTTASILLPLPGMKSYCRMIQYWSTGSWCSFWSHEIRSSSHTWPWAFTFFIALWNHCTTQMVEKQREFLTHIQSLEQPKFSCIPCCFSKTHRLLKQILSLKQSRSIL